jgi:hypothetical protein
MKHIPPPVKLMRGERFGRIVSFSRDAFKAQLANVTMRRPCSAVEIEATGRLRRNQSGPYNMEIDLLKCI